MCAWFAACFLLDLHYPVSELAMVYLQFHLIYSFICYLIARCAHSEAVTRTSTGCYTEQQPQMRDEEVGVIHSPPNCTPHCLSSLSLAWYGQALHSEKSHMRTIQHWNGYGPDSTPRLKPNNSCCTLQKQIWSRLTSCVPFKVCLIIFRASIHHCHQQIFEFHEMLMRLFLMTCAFTFWSITN